MWKFEDFTTTQILREIKFGNVEVSKTAILIPILEILDIFNTFKSEVYSKIQNA